MQLRHDGIGSKTLGKAKKCGPWKILSVGYSLRVVVLRTEFYKKTAGHPVTDKMVLTVLESRQDVPASDYIEDVINTLGIHV